MNQQKSKIRDDLGTNPGHSYGMAYGAESESKKYEYCYKLGGKHYLNHSRIKKKPGGFSSSRFFLRYS
jgi:hypothetical protein